MCEFSVVLREEDELFNNKLCHFFIIFYTLSAVHHL